jgi:hypothetical protein
MHGKTPLIIDSTVPRSNLKFCRHPYYGGRYAAIDANLVLVETEDGDWGRFDRNAKWIYGPLRHADPIFCRWVTGEIIASNHLAKGEKA